MTTTFNRVRTNLTTLLEDSRVKVMALSGKWGTGKTYLWRELALAQYGRQAASDQPITISLFGAKTIGEVKIRILQNAYLLDQSILKKILATGGGIAQSLVQKLFGVSAEDATLLWLPNIVSGRLIVIDDVERKHASLDIDEILGLIDEYSETHDTRFLLLLNTKMLADANTWATLHEKVIDAELVLDPLPIEAFDVAATGLAAPYLDIMRGAIAILNVNNIRVIGQVLAVMRRITETAENIEGIPWARVVPSTALMTVSHYRAIEDAPPIEFIKSFNHWSDLSSEKEDKSKQELNWNDLLDRLGIKLADQYEDILSEYLKSGLLDIDKLKVLFAHYRKEETGEAAAQQSKAFLTDYWWNPSMSKAELLQTASTLLAIVPMLAPDTITNIVEVVEQLGDPILSRQFLDNWIASAAIREEYQDLSESSFDDHASRLHPVVLAKLKSMSQEQNPPLAITEAVERIVKNSGWGERERSSFRNSTAAQYEYALKSLENEFLQQFLREHLNWIRNRSFDESFAIGIANFESASRNICLTTPQSRLAEILRRVFTSNGLAEKLAPSTVDPPTLLSSNT